MKTPFCLVLAAVLAGSGSARQDEDPVDPVARLQWFQGNERQNKQLLPLIDQLESEKFAERGAASRQLAALPALLRNLAKNDERPEVRFRLREISKLHPIEKESANLNAILGQIAADEIKGTLQTLAGILNMNVWIPETSAVEDAARATVTDADLPFLKKTAASESAVMRRLAAAALGGLPDEHSTAPLRHLLEDTEPSVALLAASELARRGDPSCLPAFARLLDTSDFHTRHRSWSALKGLTGNSFGFDPSADLASRVAPARRWREWNTMKLRKYLQIPLLRGGNQRNLQRVLVKSLRHQFEGEWPTSPPRFTFSPTFQDPPHQLLKALNVAAATFNAQASQQSRPATPPTPQIDQN